MDHPVLAEVAWATATSGRPTLRFNHRGAGASQGAEGSDESRAAEAEAALKLLLANTGKPAAAIVAMAEASGPALALAGRAAEACGICLIAPIGVALKEVAGLRIPVKIILGERSQMGRGMWTGLAMDDKVELIPLADDSFSQNLLQVGKAVVHFLEKLHGADAKR